MTILYNTSTYERFDSKVEWFVEIHVEKREIEWISYPHAPDGMHERLADNYSLGAKHYSGKQSPTDFMLKPKYEIDKLTHRIVHAIADDYENDVANVKALKLLLGTSTFHIVRVGGHIRPWYSCVLNDIELFKIEKVSELDITRLDLLILALSE